MCKSAIEFEARRVRACRPTALPGLPLDARLRGPAAYSPARKRACSLRTQYQHSIAQRMGLALKVVLHPKLVEAVVVEQAELMRQAAEVPYQCQLRADRVGVIGKHVLSAEGQGRFRLPLRLDQRIPRHEKVREQNVAALHGPHAISSIVGDLESSPDYRTAARDVFRPGHYQGREVQANETLKPPQPGAFD